MARRLLDRAVHSQIGARLMTTLEQAESRRTNLLRILTYHRVADRKVFEQQMRYLAAHYNVIPVSELLEVYQHGRALAARSVMITFDDGYRDVADLAWPVLKRLGLPAALFIPTAFPDRPDRIFWWARLEHALDRTQRRDELITPLGSLALATQAQRGSAYRRLKRYFNTLHHAETLKQTHKICCALAVGPAAAGVLGWDELRRLAGEGLAIGAHSRTHPFMNWINAQEAREEVVGSQDDLRREIGRALPMFCYPHGRYNRVVLEVLREAGVAVAFTTRRGTNDLDRADPLQLRRINIAPKAGLPVLRARLIHSSVHLNRWRRFFDPQPAPNGQGLHRTAEGRR